MTGRRSRDRARRAPRRGAPHRGAGNRLVTGRDGRRLQLGVPWLGHRVRRGARVRRGRRSARGRLERHRAHRPAVRQEVRRGAGADARVPARPVGVDVGERLRRLVGAADGGARLRVPRALRSQERRQGRVRRLQRRRRPLRAAAQGRAPRAAHRARRASRCAARSATHRPRAGAASSRRARCARRAIVFVVSDFLPAGDAPGLAEGARPCAPAVTTSSRCACCRPSSRRPSAPGWRACAIRNRVERASSTGAVRPSARRGRERVATWRRELAAVVRRAGVDRMDVPVPRVPDRDAVARPILEFFRMREQREIKR